MEGMVERVQPKGTLEKRLEHFTPPPHVPHHRYTSCTLLVKASPGTEWSRNGHFNAENQDNLQMNHFMGPRGCESRKEVEALGNWGQ